MKPSSKFSVLASDRRSKRQRAAEAYGACASGIEGIWHTPSKRRQLYWTLALAPFAWFGTELLTAKVGESHRIGFDPQNETCLPWRVYLVTPVRRDTSQRQSLEAALQRREPSMRGAFVQLVAHDTGSPGFEGKPLAKMVLGLPGDQIRIERDRLFVNDKEWDALWLMNRLQLAPGSLDRTYTVPERHVFVAATARSSFDSRYWGPIPLDRITGTVTAIF